MKDNTYIDKIKEIGVTVLEEYKGAKKHHGVRCDKCEHEWNTTLVFITQSNRKYNRNGCPHCSANNEQERFSLMRNNNIKKLEEKFEILSNWNGSYYVNGKIKTIVQVRNKVCGHEFSALANNLLTRNVNCPVCNKEKKTEMLNKSSIDRSEEWQETADEWELYKSKVANLTSRTYTKYKEIINPKQLPRGLAGVEGAYHLDHIKPVRYCFENGISYQDCCHHSNLQMLEWFDNVSKGCNYED